MRRKGSVLIVVLGLLAILAVVGIAFVTMSSIDRSTASNFALQTQFDLAADGAVEFACHALVQDLWGLENRTYSKLMSGLNNDEPWDAPGPGTEAGAQRVDPWLADTVEFATVITVPTNLSFGGDSVTLYTLPFRGTASIDNLGTGTNNGIWIPELAFPYEGGLIRVSITIQDHASLINLNAHGNWGAEANYWPYGDTDKKVELFWPYAKMAGWGYFISDVDPGFDTVHREYLLTGDGTQPGRWSNRAGALAKLAPGNPNVGEILFENPAAACKADGTAATEGDYPFTLDEEFDLRRIPKDTDPKFPTRIAGIIPNLDPKVNPRQRLAYTTVGWTSEARGDLDAHRMANLGNSTEGDWSARKADLNFDDPKAIHEALYYGRTCPSGSTSWGAQFAANVAGFRDGTTGCGIKGYDLETKSKAAAAASRQPILSKVSAENAGVENDQESWTIHVQIFSPWAGDSYSNDSLGLGLKTRNSAGAEMKLEVNGLQQGQILNPLPALTPQVITATGIKTAPGKRGLAEALTSLTLTYRPDNYDKDVILDQLDPDDITLLVSSPGGVSRPIFTEKEFRDNVIDPDPNNPDLSKHPDKSPVTVLYVGPWQKGLNGNINSPPQEANNSQTSGIPIRFPRSVPTSPNQPWPVIADPNYPSVGPSNLPPRAPAAGGSFKAIARLGDIDQILCDKGPADFWPWVPRVARAAANAAALTADIEANYKFNWKDSVLPGGTNVSRLNAANVLAVGGPWRDNIDNDGDGSLNPSDVKKDIQDLGTGNASADNGRFAGPELRVAGKVNLSTATTLTFLAMESGLRISGLSGLPAASTRKVFKSTAETLSPVSLLTCTVPNPNARSPLEKRDEAFNRISNIASVRSDTYSIYGTVQYGTIGSNKFNVLRSRRFWALVDRSPSLAYPPTTSNFIHPRILNFQWMN